MIAERVRQKLWAAEKKRRGYASQKGQDAWVDEIFERRKRGFFVDLAAADGIWNSNTLYLEQRRAWSGLLVEPNPDLYEQLIRNRTSHALRVCISDESGSVRFRIDNGQLGGIVADDTDNSPRYRQEQLETARIVDMDCRTLTEVLHEAGAPETIDYLSLDVEGAEERVVRGLDLDRYVFLSMTIERPTEYVNTRLKAAGYRFVKNRWFDTFYVHETHPNLRAIRTSLRFRQVPPKDW